MLPIFISLNFPHGFKKKRAYCHFLFCKASSGIGKASAEAIAIRGYYVVIGR